MAKTRLAARPIPTADAQETEPASMELPFHCYECGQSFDSAVALGSHRQREHNYRNVARRYAVGSNCRVCLTAFQDRVQLIRHIRENKRGCLDLFRTHFDMIPAEESATLDAQDAVCLKAARRCGHQRPPVTWVAVRAAGPLRRDFSRHLGHG